MKQTKFLINPSTILHKIKLKRRILRPCFFACLLVFLFGASGYGDTATFNSGHVDEDIIADGTAYDGLKFEVDNDRGMYYHDQFEGAGGSAALYPASLDSGDVLWITVTMSDLSDFKFVSVWTGANYGSYSMDVYGYRDGVVVASETGVDIELDGVSTFNFERVDLVKFQVDADLYVLFDDFTYVLLSTNTTPTISIDDSMLNFTENSAVTQVDGTATVNDADGDADWDGGTLTAQITANAEAADELSIPDNVVGTINTSGTNLLNGGTTIGTLSVSEGTVTNNSRLMITFNSNATNALVQQVLRAIHYRSTSDNPGTLNRTLTFTATDVNASSANDTRTVGVTGSNDAPTLSTNNGLMLNEGTTAGIGTALLSASDVDDSETNITFTITSGSSNGQLENTDSPGSAILTFTQQNLVDGKIQYVHDDTDTISDSFIFKVSDDQTDGPTNQIFTITVNAMPDPPTATTDAVSSITASAATLNGTVNDNGANTTVTFEYGLTTAYGTTVTAIQSLVVSGSGSSSVSKVISSLTQGTSYHYRVVAINSAGTTSGADQSFTTIAAAPVTQATNVGFASTTISSTTVSWTGGSGSNSAVFMKATSSGSSSPADGSTYTASTFFGSGTQMGATGWYCVYNGTGTSVSVSGLSANTTYRVNVCEYNGGAGSELYLTTDGTDNPVIVMTLSPEINVLGNGISIANGDTTPSIADDTDFGSVGINIGATTRSFTIQNTGTGALTLGGTPKVAVSGTHASDFAVETQPSTSIASGGSTTFTVAFNPSAIGTRVAIISIDNTDSDENPYTFSIQGTGSDAPTATTDPSSLVTASGATLNGTVNDNRENTTVTFEYGLTTAYDTPVTADESPLASGSGSSSVSKTISGLANSTTYHYRVVAVNAMGTSYGADQTFTTSHTAPSSQAMSITASGESLSGTTVNWTRGDGANCVVFLKEGDSGSASPVDNTTYTAATAFGSGTQIATSGWYCIYNGTGTSVSVTDLNAGTTYRVQVFEYNGSSGAELYLADSASDNPTNTTTLSPQMNVRGNSTSIVDGDTTPLIDDHTDFGTTDITSGTVVRTFTIENTGTGDLSLSGTLPDLVAISGTHAADFSVTAQPSSATVAASGTITFQVTFNSSAIGTRTAEVSIANSDSDENPYTFSIQGTGTDAATAATDAASSITASAATLNGTVNDNGANTTVTFEYGLSTAYGTTVTADESPLASGSGSSSFSKVISGLTANITYHYRVVATNSAGITYGEDMQLDLYVDSYIIDTDGDGISDTLEVAVGTNPFDKEDKPEFSLKRKPGSGNKIYEFSPSHMSDSVTYTIEVSTNMKDWGIVDQFTSETISVGETKEYDLNTLKESHSTPENQSIFLRAKLSQDF